MTQNDSMKILNETKFWLYYQKGDEAGLEQDLLSQYFGFEAEPEGDSECSPLKIRLDCHEFSISLEIYVDFYAINAGFRAPDDETEYQIGWWDFGEWHPFGIQWSEMIQIWNYWKANPDTLSVTPDQAFLLLAKFVGIGKSEITEVPARKQIIKSVYQGLGLDFDFKQINDLASCTFLLPPEDDYEWSNDNELGKVFSGKYPCYSLRNAHHVSGEEGVFPFRPFAAMMSKLK